MPKSHLEAIPSQGRVRRENRIWHWFVRERLPRVRGWVVIAQGWETTRALARRELRKARLEPRKRK